MSRAEGLYEADCSDDVDAFLRRCAGLSDGHASPFHNQAWLRAWYDTLGRTDGRRPVLVGVRRRDSGQDVALLPLCSQRVWGLRLVEFADATVVDYNLPILATDWAPGATLAEPLPGCRDHARALWRAVRSVLQPQHDAVRLQKMPGGSLDPGHRVANPLTLGPGVLFSEMFGNQVDVSGDWDAWRHSLNKRVRKEFERSWRVFTRSPEARFERITDPAQAMPVFEALERLQSQRMQHLGDRYRLDQAAYRDFYRRLLATGLADGSVVLADTTPLMIAVYSEQVFGDRSLYAPALQWQRLCTLTLLTGLDLPWQADGLQRDGPHVRVPVDALIRRALLEAGVSFPVVYGEGEARRDAALAPVRAALARLGAQAGDIHPAGLTEASLQDAAPAPAAGRVRLRCRDCLQPDCEHQLFAGLAREGTSALEAAPGPSS